jgi:DNA-directed RNA polymerase subunit RPC12/RpoP
MVMEDADPHSGGTFMMDEFRIEDHFKEIVEPPAKISFGCPCGRRLAAAPRMVDKRGKCPHCGARLLLVGKTHPRTGKLEIHPLVLDDAGTGDTMMIEA